MMTRKTCFAARLLLAGVWMTTAALAPVPAAAQAAPGANPPRTGGGIGYSKEVPVIASGE